MPTIENPLKDAAKEALKTTLAAYMKWQDEGDHDTFIDWVNDELTRARRISHNYPTETGASNLTPVPATVRIKIAKTTNPGAR